MSTIKYKTELYKADPADKIASGVMLSLSLEASEALPSRGMAFIKGTINKFPFQAVVEPDGKGSHWFKVSEDLQKAAGAEAGDTVSLEIESSKDWPEPMVPTDLKKALDSNPEVVALWQDITPMARWDWIRWIGSTRNPDTRAKHVHVAIDKMRKGMRRPCCWEGCPHR